MSEILDRSMESIALPSILEISQFHPEESKDWTADIPEVELEARQIPVYLAQQCEKLLFSHF